MFNHFQPFLDRVPPVAKIRLIFFLDNHAVFILLHLECLKSVKWSVFLFLSFFSSSYCLGFAAWLRKNLLMEGNSKWRQSFKSSPWLCSYLLKIWLYYWPTKISNLIFGKYYINYILTCTSYYVFKDTLNKTVCSQYNLLHFTRQDLLDLEKLQNIFDLEYRKHVQHFLFSVILGKLLTFRLLNSVLENHNLLRESWHCF